MITILAAGVISLVATLIGTKYLIVFLVHRGYGQFIRDDGPTTHRTKRGTPTMGGAVVIAATVAAYLLAHLISSSRITASGLLILGLLAATGFIGFLDDWTKISKQRSLGLTPRGKLIGQVLVGVAFSGAALLFPAASGNVGARPASVYISIVHDIEWLRLPVVLAIFWMTLLITGFSNAVNLTDGLDGLATGASTMVFGAFALMGIFASNQWCLTGARLARCYDVRDPSDLAVVSIALAAACFGFLWWNAKPAKIFLGDTGSLGLGAAMAGLAIFSRTEILLVVLGLLFVIETLSVMIQVGYFKYSGGKRVFKMAPLHHHFELLGWAETTVVVRFWIICGVSVAMALGIFYGAWVWGW
ncbi:phospho-N-acetylmuramoyl-pentapeptide-transferase [Propionibacterium cyclohexanicum]|uniref:Phospho-N-acetylmuramoyl-pentapeptide-transferase n=1 Tax=Propionibacterium cyclohexanicum TaxID=64702 RepID=A0A1H9PJI1_9ACTN|nr:phospho-N-acetylmuramoyl-pentapeptide-transferase [Propionibacterium cyclohexanicum]SER48297.1 phospho-N-acetylmuramoyl-pentapeptide-transferase [Propionibacterium cyclohexanicum]